MPHPQATRAAFISGVAPGGGLVTVGIFRPLATTRLRQLSIAYNNIIFNIWETLFPAKNSKSDNQFRNPKGRKTIVTQYKHFYNLDVISFQFLLFYSLSLRAKLEFQYIEMALNLFIAPIFFLCNLKWRKFDR